MDKAIIYIWRAPAGHEARYVTVTERGELLAAYKKLSDISAYYRKIYGRGKIELVRQLEKTWKPNRTYAHKHN